VANKLRVPLRQFIRPRTRQSGVTIAAVKVARSTVFVGNNSDMYARWDNFSSLNHNRRGLSRGTVFPSDEKIAIAMPAQHNG
jgi:hypothetical protein